MRQSDVLPPAVEAVLHRWNPDGMDLLRRLRIADPSKRAVALFDPSGAETGQLADELARLEPKLDIVASPLEAVVVVMLLDACAPLGREALRAIDELLTTGSRAVFALVGIEAHRDWRAVRDRDVALLGKHARGATDLRIWPASPRLAAVARKVPAGVGDAELVFAKSGITQLHAALIEALADDPAGVRVEHLTRATTAVLRQTRRSIEHEAETLRADDETVAALRIERTQLTTRRDGGRGEVIAALRTQLQLARVDLLHDAGGRVRAANVAARSQLDRTGRAELADFPGWLASLVRRLTAEVDRDIGERMSELASRVDPDGRERRPASAIIRNPAPEVADGPEPRHHTVEDRMMILVGASAGVGLGRLAVAPLSLVPALDIASVPAALVLGGGAAWWLTRARQQLADRGHVRRWATETLVDVKAQLEQRVVSALVETEALLVEKVVRRSTARMVEVDRQLAEINAQVRESTTRRSGQLAACDRDLTVITEGMAERQA